MIEFNPSLCVLDPRRDCPLICPIREDAEIAMEDCGKKHGIGNPTEVRDFFRSELNKLPFEKIERAVREKIENADQEIRACVQYANILEALEL